MLQSSPIHQICNQEMDNEKEVSNVTEKFEDDFSGMEIYSALISSEID